MRVVIIGAGLAARHLAHLANILAMSAQGAQSLAVVEIARRGPEIDFYPTQPSKQTAQWKRETRGKRLK